MGICGRGRPLFRLDRTPMASSPWKALLEAPGNDRHLVQFYHDETFLTEAVGAWSSHALHRGGAALLVATPEHGRLIRGWLAGRGLDAEDLAARGRLLVVDADGLLNGFMRDGAPDPARFHALVGNLVQQARTVAAGGEVRAWGEMVNLLWQRGELAAAQRLECLWNEVIDGHGFHLLCSYRVDNLAPETHKGLVRDLTVGHSQLIPDADYARLDAAVERALADVFGPDQARTLRALFVARQAPRRGMPAGEAVLVGLHELHPALADRVLERARAYFASPAVDGAAHVTA